MRLGLQVLEEDRSTSDRSGGRVHHGSTNDSLAKILRLRHGRPQTESDLTGPRPNGKNPRRQGRKYHPGRKSSANEFSLFLLFLF